VEFAGNLFYKYRIHGLITLKQENQDMPYHTVKQGEWLSAIAQKYGFDGDTLWHLDENKQLKQARNSPHVLHPGDKIFIPERDQKNESINADSRWKFKVKGKRIPLKLQLEAPDGSPLREKQFKLTTKLSDYEGTTSANGEVNVSVPNHAQNATLTIWLSDAPKDTLVYNLRLGHLDPATEISGVQARLNNLGYSAGKNDGILGPKTKAAIRAFRRDHGLTAGGEVDSAFVDKLKDEHSS